MAYAIEIQLQLVNLPQNLVEASYLSVRRGNRIPCSVILLLGYLRRLIGEVLHACLDLLHEAVEMATKSCEGGAIEEEEALGGGARCCAGRRGVGGGGLLLVVPEEGNLVVG